MKPFLRVFLILTLLTVMPSCGRDTSTNDEAVSGGDEIIFEIDASYLGPLYEHAELGLQIRPPEGWEQVTPEQKEAISGELEKEQAGSEYRLRLEQAFFDTETLSFLALSTVQTSTDLAFNLDAYTAELSRQIDAEDDGVASSATFTVNGILVNQYLFVREGRVNFALVMSGSDGQVAQLDYSIPQAVYEAESVKLESSIGSIQRVSTD
jgi:hypothetical protein